MSVVWVARSSAQSEPLLVTSNPAAAHVEVLQEWENYLAELAAEHPDDERWLPLGEVVNSLLGELDLGQVDARTYRKLFPALEDLLEEFELLYEDGDLEFFYEVVPEVENTSEWVNHPFVVTSVGEIVEDLRSVAPVAPLEPEQVYTNTATETDSEGSMPGFAYVNYDIAVEDDGREVSAQLGEILDVVQGHIEESADEVVVEDLDNRRIDIVIPPEYPDAPDFGIWFSISLVPEVQELEPVVVAPVVRQSQPQRRQEPVVIPPRTPEKQKRQKPRETPASKDGAKLNTILEMWAQDDLRGKTKKYQQDAKSRTRKGLRGISKELGMTPFVTVPQLKAALIPLQQQVMSIVDSWRQGPPDMARVRANTQSFLEWLYRKEGSPDIPSPPIPAAPPIPEPAPLPAPEAVRPEIPEPAGGTALQDLKKLYIDSTFVSTRYRGSGDPDWRNQLFRDKRATSVRLDRVFRELAHLLYGEFTKPLEWPAFYLFLTNSFFKNELRDFVRKISESQPEDAVVFRAFVEWLRKEKEIPENTLLPWKTGRRTTRLVTPTDAPGRPAPVPGSLDALFEDWRERLGEMKVSTSQVYLVISDIRWLLPLIATTVGVPIPETIEQLRSMILGNQRAIADFLQNPQVPEGVDQARLRQARTWFWRFLQWMYQTKRLEGVTQPRIEEPPVRPFKRRTPPTEEPLP